MVVELLGDMIGERPSQAKNLEGNAIKWAFDVPYFWRSYSAIVSAFTRAGEGIRSKIDIPFILPPETFLGMSLEYSNTEQQFYNHIISTSGIPISSTT